MVIMNASHAYYSHEALLQKIDVMKFSLLILVYEVGSCRASASRANFNTLS